MPAPLQNRKYVAQYEFDFAKDGGAVGDITMRGGPIPSGAVVDYAILDVQTAFTSGGAATVAIAQESAEDVKAAAVLTSYTAGVKACVPNKTATNSIKTDASGAPVMTVAVAALTAGKAVLVLEYFITE